WEVVLTDPSSCQSAANQTISTARNESSNLAAGAGNTASGSSTSSNIQINLAESSSSSAAAVADIGFNSSISRAGLSTTTRSAISTCAEGKTAHSPIRHPRRDIEDEEEEDEDEDDEACSIWLLDY
ncbi:unnamed protein product, partial [Protopolystoma xenopodis]